MVKEGDIIDIVFPSTCSTEAEILKIKNYLKNINLIPRILYEEKSTPRINLDSSLSNISSQIRFEQLYEALNNQQSTVVWCGRGGYGSGDLLPLLSQSKPIKQNKIFIGFSDIVSISTFLQQSWGWKIICGPMLIQMCEDGLLAVNKKSQTKLLDLIFGKKNQFEYGLIQLNKTKNKDITSKITGGCLSVLCGHFGGDYQIDFKDKILFLEDIEESGEKLDRYFRQIIEVILKTKQKPSAVLLGSFFCNIKDKSTKENILEAFNKLINRINQFKLDIPVFKAQDELGHSSKMYPLILGVESKIDLKKSQLIISKIF